MKYLNYISVVCILMLFLKFSSEGFAQNYFDETSEWTFVNFDCYGEDAFFDRTYYIEGDTSVSDVFYWKIYFDQINYVTTDCISGADSIYYTDSVFFGLIRQDGFKVYFMNLTPGNGNFGIEKLSMDYDLQVGDSIVRPLSEGGPSSNCLPHYFVTKIEYINFANEVRRVFYLNDPRGQLIEGMGNYETGFMSGYCNYYYQPVDTYSGFDCYSQLGFTKRISPDSGCPDISGDNSHPVIACNLLGNLPLSAFDFCNGVPDLTDVAVIYDNQDTSLFIFQTPAPGTPLVDSFLIKLYAVDDGYNISWCVLPVTDTSDHMPPEIFCPYDIQKVISATQSSAFVDIPLPTVQDNCELDEWHNDYNGLQDASDIFPIGNSIVEFVATDVAGNISTCAVNVLVQIDTTAPQIFCPGAEDVDPAISDCEPTFTSGCFDDYVDRIKILDATNAVLLNNAHTGCNGTDGYFQFPVNPGVTSCTIYTSQSYTLEASGHLLWTEYFGVWIDWNNDGDFFDTDEWLSSSISNNEVFGFSIPIVVSNIGVTPGLHRMRLMTQFAEPLGQFDCCTTSQWGECEDYLINIQAYSPELSCTTIPDYTHIVMLNDEVLSAITFTQTPNPADYIPGSFITLTATDESGNSSICSFIPDHYDNSPPTIVCPSSVAMNYDDTGTYVHIEIPLVSDSCAAQNEIILTNSQFSGSDASGYYPFGEYTVTFTAEDLVGLTSTCQVSLSVVPYDVFCPADLNLDGYVNIQDFLLLMEAFGCINGCSYDIDNDGVVSSSDIQLMMGDFDTNCY